MRWRPQTGLAVAVVLLLAVQRLEARALIEASLASWIAEDQSQLVIGPDTHHKRYWASYLTL